MFGSTPWLTWSSWRSVYEALCESVGSNDSDNYNDRRGSSSNFQHCAPLIKRIRLWQCRRFTGCPVSVSVTADLLEVLLNDYHNSYSSSALQNMYAGAISRLVNGIVDQGNSTLFFARAAEGIAKDIGMPELLVSIRHDASHGKLPSLQRLRSGAWIALEFLMSSYWDEQYKAAEASGYFDIEEAPEVHVIEAVIDDMLNNTDYNIEKDAGGDADFSKLVGAAEKITTIIRNTSSDIEKRNLAVDRIISVLVNCPLSLLPKMMYNEHSLKKSSANTKASTVVKSTHGIDKDDDEYLSLTKSQKIKLKKQFAREKAAAEQKHLQERALALNYKVDVAYNLTRSCDVIAAVCCSASAGGGKNNILADKIIRRCLEGMKFKYSECETFCHYHKTQTQEDVDEDDEDGVQELTVVANKDGDEPEDFIGFKSSSSDSEDDEDLEPDAKRQRSSESAALTLSRIRSRISSSIKSKKLCSHCLTRYSFAELLCRLISRPQLYEWRKEEKILDGLRNFP
jgi:hypothetical protein